MAKRSRESILTTISEIQRVTDAYIHKMCTLYKMGVPVCPVKFIGKGKFLAQAKTKRKPINGNWNNIEFSYSIQIVKSKYLRRTPEERLEIVIHEACHIVHMVAGFYGDYSNDGHPESWYALMKYCGYPDARLIMGLDQL